MKHGLFTRLFPPPRYLRLPAFGFDLSDRSLKFIKLEQVGHHSWQVVSFGEKTIPLNVLQSGEIKDEKALVEILKSVKDEWHLEHVIMALPEEKAFIVRIHLPNVEPGGEREAIELQLEEYVPLPANEVIFDYELVPEKRHTAIVSVLPRKEVVAYENILGEAGLTPLAFEVEAQAVARAVVPAGTKETTLVIDFGKTRTSFFVVRSNQVLFTSTTRQLGGDIITHAIEKTLGLTNTEAETIKLKQGLLAGPEQERLTTALVPTLSVLRDEITKLEEYWKKHLANSGAGEGNLEKIVLCGGEATLPGLVEYLMGQVSLPVEIGNVWSNVLDLNYSVPPLDFRQSLRYATAIGLALRSK